MKKKITADEMGRRSWASRFTAAEAKGLTASELMSQVRRKSLGKKRAVQNSMKKKAKKKSPRYPDYTLVKNPDGTPTSHMLDSVWIRNDGLAIKIVFATGKILDFEPVTF